jgi:hypothetical protein
MRTVKGSPKIDGLFIGEVKVNLLNFPDVQMEVVIGYIESESGRRLGSTSKLGGWSPETLSRLNAFIESVEQDAADDVMKTTTASGSGVVPYTTDGVPGM